MRPLILGLTVLMSALFSSSACAEEPTPGYNTKIPDWVLTPDTVETRLGTLEFFDGIPNEKAAAALFANLDLNRALQAITEWNAGLQFRGRPGWSRCPWPGERRIRPLSLTA